MKMHVFANDFSYTIYNRGNLKGYLLAFLITQVCKFDSFISAPALKVLKRVIGESTNKGVYNQQLLAEFHTLKS